MAAAAATETVPALALAVAINISLIHKTEPILRIQLKLTKKQNRKKRKAGLEQRRRQPSYVYTFSNSFDSHSDSFVWNAYSKASKQASRRAILCHHHHSRVDVVVIFWFRLRCLHRLLILFICVYMQLYSLKKNSAQNKTIHYLHSYGFFCEHKARRRTTAANGHWERVYPCARQIQYYFSFNQSEYMYAELCDAQPIRILLMLFFHCWCCWLLLLLRYIFHSKLHSHTVGLLLVLSFNFPIRAQCQLNQCSNEKSFQKLINDLVN